MRKNRLAFTLIELLVTIVLFSLLLATALYSFKFISINIKNINNTNPQRAMNFNFLRDVFSSTYYYIDTDEKANKGNVRFYHYFKGRKESCRFISNASVFYDELVIVQLTLVDGVLLYEEGKIFSKKIDYKKIDKIKLTQKIKILKNIDKLNFSYISNGKRSLEISKNIPDSLEINFEKNGKKYRYLFSIKSSNKLKLEVLKRDYDMMHTSEGVN